VKNERPIKALEKKFKGTLEINWAGTTWMNDDLTKDYLNKIIGGSIFSENRLLVWDAFQCHKSEATKKVLKQLKVEAAYIPGGCTKFIQVGF
jgi:hypothetical protein